MNKQAIVDLLKSEHEEDFQLANNILEIHEIDLFWGTYEDLNSGNKWYYKRDGRYKFTRNNKYDKRGIWEQIKDMPNKTYNSSLPMDDINKEIVKLYGNHIEHYEDI